MPRKYENPRLTKRDRIIIRWIAEQQVVRLDTLSDLFEFKFNRINRSDLYALCEKWKRLGYINKSKLLGDVPLIIWITNSGMKMTGMPLDQREKISKPSITTVLHGTALSAVRLMYEKNGYIWICERLLRSDFQSSHLPDGMAYNNDFRILVEVDRTRKEAKRTQNIMAINARTPGISCVDYWVTSEVFPFTKLSSEKLPADLSNKIRVFPLPEEINL